jgi:alanyl-tRNA synthetase
MSDLESEYRLDYFEEHGFHRLDCAECGAAFWTRDGERETCGEPPCETYSFIDNPGFADEYSLAEMREAFLSFFEERDHERVDPYPVAANRWRDDVLLTQASIYDFQPLVTSGETPPPANPLTISQPCIRMQDIDNVGKTGRHTMAFEMMAHHAFNAREESADDSSGQSPREQADYAYEGEVYWKEETVAYCEELLDELGADLSEVTYIEDPWVGGGNAGPAFEVIYRGLELATLVFMSMEQDPDGDYLLKDGNCYSKMDTYVVDTGYGLERWTWISQGTPTIYEAIYPEMIDVLTDNAGIEHTDEEAALVHDAARLSGNLDIDDVDDVEEARADIAAELGVDVETLRELVEPLESIYAIADHCRTLAYMLGDEIVPSNVGTGYLARMVLRRTKRLAEDVGVDAPLDELVDMQAERLGYENRDTIREIVRTEVERYRETLERGTRRVESLAEEYAREGEAIPTDELVELYDSHGIQPETVAEIARERGVDVEIPDDFYALVAQRHGDESDDEETEETPVEEFAGLPETERLYYDDQTRMEFEAMVLEVREREAGYDVVLDQTMFYPEGGGQPADRGTLSTEELTTDVRDVQLVGDVVVHRTDGDPGTGEFVRGTVDSERRLRHMRHHTATHLVGHAAREVLGEHVRQAGAQKGTESARLDIRHYESVSREQLEAIERRANNFVMADDPVKQEWLDRNDAEDEHGFDIYQGGIPEGEQIRLIHAGADTQACGGTHVSHTGEVGFINLLGSERVQDGVVRLTYAAGEAAVEAGQETERRLNETADVLDVSPTETPETARRFFEEWKARGKRIEQLKEDLAAARASGDDGEEVDIDGTSAVIQRLDGDMDQLRATANALVAEGKIAVIGSGTDGAQFVVAVPDGVGVDAGAVVGELARRVGGGGGGPPDFAQGGGPDTDQLDGVLDDAPDILRERLNV